MNFHHIFNIYKQDWKRIAKNPVAIIIIVGISVIPSLYAWVNIKACWNVYENTSDIPVAVVNNDKSVTFDGKHLNIGDNVVEQLKKNDKIKWEFVDSKQADLGLADSTYYAAIEIPEDFSAKFLTVLTDHPQKPQIIYKADTKVNPVAGKITETAKNSLVQEITSNFVSTVNSTVFSSLNTVGKDADKNRDNILQIKDSIVKINSGMGAVTDSLQTIHTGSDNLSQLLTSVNAALPTIQSGLQVVAQNNIDRQKAITSTQSALNSSIHNVDVNLDYVQTSNSRIQGLFADLNEAAAQGNQTTVNSLLPGINTELDSMDSAIDATIAYLKQCQSLDFNDDIDSVIQSLQKLRKSLLDLETQLKQFQLLLRQTPTDVKRIYADLATAITDLQTINDLVQSTADQLTELNSTLNDPNIAQLITALNTLHGDLDNLIAQLKKVQGSEDSVLAAIDSLDKTITNVNKSIDAIIPKIDAAITFLQSTEKDDSAKKEQLANIIKSLQKTKPYIQDEKAQFSTIQQQLNDTNAIGKNIADSVNKDAAQISTQLISAQKLYNSGVKDDLNKIADSLTVSAKDAADLIQTAQGLNSDLEHMVSTAQNGSEFASNFSADLNKRLLEFKDVISLLSDKMQLVGNNDIAQIISILQSNPEFMGSLISNPFDLKTESINAIPNYGSSMAPIYTTLALWVGCLILNSIFKTRVGYFKELETYSVREKHFGKMLLFVTLAVAQGLIASLGDLFILQIYRVNGFLFVTFCVMSSLVFSIITYTLVSTLGNVGKAVSIIYMILQLAGSGGTYPIQVDPPVFKILQPLFPFTYTVGGLREAIAGPLVTSVVQDFVGLTLFAIVFLLFGYFRVEPLRKRIHTFEKQFKESGLGE